MPYSPATECDVGHTINGTVVLLFGTRPEFTIHEDADGHVAIGLGCNLV